MKKGVIALIAIVVLLVLWGFSSYNGIVRLNEKADAQWAYVETSYQRRLDLIPNLVNVVKGQASHETEVFQAIADARTRYAGATTPNEKAAAATQVESSLARLLVIAENYPTLTSAASYQNLMSQLESTENRVSVERNKFNDTVRDYNMYIKVFPKNIFANLMGFGTRNYFEAAQGAEKAPTVNL